MKKNRVNDYTKLVNTTGGMDVQELIRQEKQLAKNKQNLSKKENEYHTHLQILAIATIISILFAIAAYLDDLFTK